MTTFSTDQSGLFSAGDYNESTKTLSAQFRSSGQTYEVHGVSKELGERFMASAGKSALWHSDLKPMGPVKAS